MAGSIMTVTKDLKIYARFSDSKSGHMGQNWNTFFYIKGSENHELGTSLYA
jgi:hypothetical protein